MSGRGMEGGGGSAYTIVRHADQSKTPLSPANDQCVHYSFSKEMSTSYAFLRINVYFV